MATLEHSVRFLLNHLFPSLVMWPVNETSPDWEGGYEAEVCAEMFRVWEAVYVSYLGG
jgi:hypothetical protein